MKELTNLLEAHGTVLDGAFRQGVGQASLGRSATRMPGPVPNIRIIRDVWAKVRAEYGFAEVATPLLTPPDANAKLDKATTPSYGLTLQHFRTKLRSGLSVNSCPNAGHCIKVCVLDNGNGGFPAVQRARQAKTEFLVRHPDYFAYLLGFELQKAAIKHGKILFRPNVNSDIAWERLLPSLVNGTTSLGARCESYGYSKRPEVLETNGWLGDRYRVAYSWNETSYDVEVTDFLERGGSVAVVTARKKGAPVLDITQMPTGLWATTRVLDADKTDEWIFESNAIGDLSAKGKARNLIGKSKFVVQV